MFSGRFSFEETTKSLSTAVVEEARKKSPLAVYCLLTIFPISPNLVIELEPELISSTKNCPLASEPVFSKNSQLKARVSSLDISP